MEANDLGSFALVEMALNGVPHLLAKLFQRVCYGKDGLAKRAGCETTFRRLFDEEYQFVHFVRAMKYPLYRLAVSLDSIR